jgi:hypothetical protein
MSRKRAFSAISALLFGIPCAAYLRYASAKSLERLDLAKKSRFQNPFDFSVEACR